jgi:ABC-type sugar transport system, permease component
MSQRKATKKTVKMSRTDKLYQFIGYIVFALLILICAFPFYYLLISTISNNQLVELGRIYFLPKGIHFQNYVKILRLDNILSSAFITLSRTMLGTLFTILVTSYMAYFFTKQNMWGRKFWYRLVVITMYFSAGMIPDYLNLRQLGLLNSFAVYIVPGAISVYNMILVKTSIEALPASLEESALLDGAGYFTCFGRIILPLQKPILATIGLFTAVWHWNDFFTTKLYITNTRLYTLQFRLYELLSQVTSAATQIDIASIDQLDAAATAITPTAIRLTLTAVVVLPIMCVYPFIQKYYVKGIMIGAVKG